MKKKQPKKQKQWAKFIVVLLLYLLFIYWLGSWMGLLVVPFIYDVYISKKINWQWWKEAEGPTKWVMSWVDAIVFALVAVYFINLFFFQNYVIPSSSLEKSLLTGDYLFVSKVSYGPRIPQTPLTMPLTQHTLPVFECKSYIEWPQWDYRRVKGLGQVELNDIVVFNYPAGDTILTHYETYYYQFCYDYGTEIYAQMNPAALPADSLSKEDQLKRYEEIYALGSAFIKSNPNYAPGPASYPLGQVDTRPVDRRENYVKRCVGLPGQTLQIKNRIVYLDGKENKQPENVQFTYFVKLNNLSFYDLASERMDDLRKDLQITLEDVKSLADYGYMPLTERAAKELKDRGVASEVRIVSDDFYRPFNDLYPRNGNTHWTRDNYGPIWIPKKGASVDLSLDNIAIYERPIRIYEGNDLQVRDGKIFINGKETTSYTFKMDYYWMMGDNRHNSADSRYWGFVPEDHIVGKPIFIWWSSDPDRHGFSGIRWNRLFRIVDNIK